MAAAKVSVPGLERLTQLAKIKVHQMSSGFYGNNYTILGGGEEVLFNLDEKVPDSCFRNRGSHRAFNFDGVENTERKMFTFHRQTGRIFVADKVELYMNGELLQTNTKTVLGGLQRTSRELRDEMFSCNDDYIISFPAELDVQLKIAVIVACVYIDFRFHEGK